LFLTSAGWRERHFDSLFGVQTEGVVDIGELGASRSSLAHARGYAPTPAKVFVDLLRKIKLQLEKVTFVDLGCGKGRVLLVASQFPFKRIIGVELSPDLALTAQRNIASYSNAKQECTRIEVMCLDASHYAIPEEKAVIYLFHPFDEHVLARVLDNIHLSRQVHTEDLYVIYRNPMYEELFNLRPYFECVYYDKEYSAIYKYRCQ
jgi:SAM-dependent methyltransferase